MAIEDPYDQLVRCPFCDESIRRNAVKCKHCGSLLTPIREEGDTTKALKIAFAGKYEIVEEIAKGGMAVIYKAIQSNLQRHIALKILPSYLTRDQEYLNRFHREAQQAAQLVHPNIVIIYDEGVQNNFHYIAMEYLDGTDVHSLVRRKGYLPYEEAIGILSPIAEALDYAHSKGVVHRDVKSSNIMLTEAGRPVLLDFGIAHILSDSKLTTVGSIMGTPEYMSPEQAQGKTVDARSDLYSLGVVLYECLTGSPPFRGENPIATIYQIINDPVPKLPEGYSDADKVVVRALEKIPSNRFSTGMEFSKALRTRSYGTEVKWRSLHTEPKNVHTSVAGWRPTKLWAQLSIVLILAIVSAIIGVVLLEDPDDSPKITEDSSNIVIVEADTSNEDTIKSFLKRAQLMLANGTKANDDNDFLESIQNGMYLLDAVLQTEPSHAEALAIRNKIKVLLRDRIAAHYRRGQSGNAIRLLRQANLLFPKDADFVEKKRDDKISLTDKLDLALRSRLWSEALDWYEQLTKVETDQDKLNKRKTKMEHELIEEVKKFVDDEAWGNANGLLGILRELKPPQHVLNQMKIYETKIAAEESKSKTNQEREQ